MSNNNIGQSGTKYLIDMLRENENISVLVTQLLSIVNSTSGLVFTLIYIFFKFGVILTISNREAKKVRSLNEIFRNSKPKL